MNLKKQILGWLMYDWANSAYVLTVATAILPTYFASAVATGGTVDILGVNMAASSAWGYAVSLAALLVFATAPVLGAIADSMNCKKKMLGFFAVFGSCAAMGLFAIGPGQVWAALGIFILANASFASANVFYDALLPGLGQPKDLDTISGKGFASGYVGGGLHFLLCLVLVLMAGKIGMSKDLAARISMASAGAWWLVFSLPVLLWTRESGPFSPELPARKAQLVPAVKTACAKTMATAVELSRNKKVFYFLAAYFLYNDGVQTTIAMAAIYGKEVLNLPQAMLMGTLLMVQAVAFAGALAFSRLAGKIGTLKTIRLAVILWTGIAVFGALVASVWQYVLLGAMVGTVLGGTQALSRSFYATLVPADSPAGYFSFFSVITKMSAIAGPLIFAVVGQTTGNIRFSAGAVAVLFLLSLGLMGKVSGLPHAGKDLP